MDQNEIHAERVNQYYGTQYEAYFEKTVRVDPASFLTPFAQQLDNGSRLWDIGCGSGRDLLWLKKQGFKPTGLERSMGLARFAWEHSGCPVVVGNFESFDFSRIDADGMLLTAALVHVPPKRLKVVLENILSGLRVGGILFVSMKQGTGIFQDRTGRRFYLWQSHELESIFELLHLMRLTVSANPSALGTKEMWLTYLLQKG